MFTEEKVTYFGHMIEDSQPAKNREVAINYILGRAQDVLDEDLTHDKTFCGYVYWLRRQITRPELADRLMTSLLIRDQAERYKAVTGAAEALARNVSS